MVNAEVIATHVSEAAFLWRHRERAARAPHFNLSHLLRLDDRLQAHLLALPQAGEVAHRLTELSMGDGEPAPVFVAAWLACARSDAAGLERLTALAGGEAAAADALVAALSWRPIRQTQEVIRGLLASRLPHHRVIGLRVVLDRRLQAIGSLTRYLSDDAAPVRALAATLVGSLKRTQDIEATRALFADTDAGVRLAAARALALLGDTGAGRELLACANASQAGAEAAAPVLVGCLDLGGARLWIQSLTKNPATLRLGIRATGLLGDTRAADWLLGLMDDMTHARLAGEAFAMMTGVDLDPMALRRDPPEGLDADADPPEDEADLGWPDPHKLKQWWAARRAEMPAGRRYLGGQAVSTGSATHSLRHGYQRQRAQAAVELALLDASAMEFPVQAPGPWQRQRLAA